MDGIEVPWEEAVRFVDKDAAVNMRAQKLTELFYVYYWDGTKFVRQLHPVAYPGAREIARQLRKTYADVHIASFGGR